APSACPRSPSPPDGSPPSRSSRPDSSSRGYEPRKHPRGVILLPLLPRLLRAHGTAGDAMSKVFLGGFVVIAAVAVAAVDYVNQARRAGSAPGAFAVAAYVGTVSGRSTGTPAPAAAPAAAARPAAAPVTGGVLGMISGLFGGKSDGSAADTGAQKPEVRVNGLGGNCAVAGGIKRCSIGGG